MTYRCQDDTARRIEARAAGLNGVEYLEVLDEPGQPGEERRRILLVAFLTDPTPLGLTAENVVIEGGEVVRHLRVVDATVAVDPRSGTTDPVLVVLVDRPGDYSRYVLRIRPTSGNPLDGMDRRLDSAAFSFTVNFRSEIDPLVVQRCAEPPVPEPALDYLARDFTSLRQTVVDRLSLLVPGWTDHNPADLGTTLVELLAYVGDLLSYRQDAVATEAYLGTCRLRTSARRHARLVDYLMHDGCNARTWVHLAVDGSAPVRLTAARFYPPIAAAPPVIRPGSDDARRATASGAAAFELMEPVTLVPEHNRMRLYTWGSRQCVLPAGAVTATLRGSLPHLAPGMVVVFVEERGPRSGDPDDADLSRRHAVRLTAVSPGEDPVGGRFDPRPHDDPVPVTEIAWSRDDALPFSVCVSAEAAPEYGGGFLDDVSVVLGNIALADHGAWVEEDLAEVPADTMRRVLADPVRHPDSGRPERVGLVPARFRPALSRGPISQVAPYDARRPGAARAALETDAHAARPALTLHDRGTEWSPQPDLLSSAHTAPHLVVEVESDGRARLRFGDGRSGARPPAGTRFRARYRVGNGTAGNIGANALQHVVCDVDVVRAVSNPLPATGGQEPESVDDVRQHAPVAFRPRMLPGPDPRPDGRSLQRAVTPADYAAVAEIHPAVQRAAATSRWTGSWRAVSVSVDPRGGGEVDADLESDLRTHLEPFRLAGHDVVVDRPVLVGLDLALTVVVRPGYYPSQIHREVLDVLSERVLPDGRRGLFHPDDLTFGQTVFLSPVYLAVQRLDGVAEVDVTVFRRRDRPGDQSLADGRITMGRFEIARLANDPDFPDRGTLTITLTVDGAR